MEWINGLDDDPPPPSGGKGFGGKGIEKKRSPGDFSGLLLSNQTHRSTSVEKARLFKKARRVCAFLSFMGHCAMENHHDLVVATEVSQATPAAWLNDRPRCGYLFAPWCRPNSRGADKGYDTRAFVADLRIQDITPHVTLNPRAEVDQGSMVTRRGIRVTSYRSTPVSESIMCSPGSRRSLLRGSSSQPG